MRAVRFTPVVAALAAGWFAVGAPAAETPDLSAGRRLRRPVAVVPRDGLLYVANRDSGTLSRIDLRQERVRDEFRIGRQLADLRPLPRGRLLAVDEGGGEIVLLAPNERSIEVVGRLEVPMTPVSVVVSADGRLAAVASLWARQVTLVDIDVDRHTDRNAEQRAARHVDTAARSGDAPLRKRATLDLPFAPRKLWLSPDRRTLVAADAFGGQLALVDPQQAKLLGLRSIEGHNIRGLAASRDGRELLIAHQLLNPDVPTTEARVFWGTVLSNVLRSVRLDHLRDFERHGAAESETDVATDGVLPRPVAHWSLDPLGEPKQGAGDPADLILLPSDQIAVALAGVDQVALRSATSHAADRLDVGRRPTALAVGPAGRELFVANTLDDTVSRIDLATRRVTATISLGPSPERSAIERGERLFFSARLALDGWFSCHSCHTDGHSCGLRNDNFSDGGSGSPKRILSLLGVAQSAPWAWNGEQHSLTEQLRASVHETMRGEKSGLGDPADLTDLAAYLSTLGPPPPIDDARGRRDPAAVARGDALFGRQRCDRCHRPPSYTAFDTFDVGLEDEQGTTRFNPPSLLGVSQRGPYFHDNRAATLRDVLTGHAHPGSDGLTPAELADLLTFLRSL